MKKLVFGMAAFAAITSSAFAADGAKTEAFSKADLEKCIKAVETKGCQISGKDEDRIEDYVVSCKQFKQGSHTVEAFLVKDIKSEEQVKSLPAEVTYRLENGVYILTRVSATTQEIRDQHKIVTIDLSSEKCDRTKYTIDEAGIKEMKAVDNRLYMISNDGQAYFMDSREYAYEILSDKGNEYTEALGSDVQDIRGPKPEEKLPAGTVILSRFSKKGKEQIISKLTPAKLADKVKKGNVKTLTFKFLPLVDDYGNPVSPFNPKY